MDASTRALLSEIIDYAGLFPPARLDLEPALRAYARYRTEPDAWMLGKFVCPAARLPELTEHGARLFSHAHPIGVSVLVGGGEQTPQFLDTLRRDVLAIRDFRAAAGGWARIEAMELRVPEDVCRSADAGTASEFLIDVEECFVQCGEEPLTPDYHEFTLPDRNREALDALARGFAQYCRGGGRASPTPAGVKLRCGGLEASAVPDSEWIAAYIEVCREHQLPLKFTAGLHHALPRFDPAVRTTTHGFLNVFVGGVLAYALPLPHHDLRAILDETDARHFHFGPEFLGWNDADASVGEVRFARQHRVLSFGSCSFDEPREDLRQLGLI